MEWKAVWSELPKIEGVYLGQIEEHYGIFSFCGGGFHPNDWCDYSGINADSSYVGGEHCITHWMTLPNLKEMNDEDIKKYKKWRKNRNSNDKARLD